MTKPKLSWMKYLADMDMQRRVAIEVGLIKAIERAKAELETFQKESVAEAKKYCTANEIRKAKNGLA